MTKKLKAYLSIDLTLNIDHGRRSFLDSGTRITVVINVSVLKLISMISVFMVTSCAYVRDI